MPNTQDKIVRLIDGNNPNIQASIRQHSMEGALLVEDINGGSGASSFQWDSMVMNYIESGDLAGEIDTIVYSYLGSVVLTKTFGYDAQGRVSGITKS